MRYYSYNNYLRDKFGSKVRKISLNAGFLCPHKREGGCVFCNESGFSEAGYADLPLAEQIELAMAQGRAKGSHSFVAYFQNATNTNADISELKKAYDVIKDYPEIVGLSISTRPDCVDDEKLDLIAGYKDKYDVWIEYGVQTIHDKTLAGINRGHTYSQAEKAVLDTAGKGINVTAHVILGLPGESPEDMMETARKIASLPVSGIKLHTLHVLRDTELEGQYHDGKIPLLSKEEYVKIACDFLEYTRPDTVVMRIVSDVWKDYLVAPVWENDKLSVIREIEAEFERRGTRQGIKARLKDKG